jgi:hypothetical protein
MIGKEYLARQATTLLQMAKTVKNPQVAAGLAEKALDFKERLEKTPSAPDLSPSPPDVEPRS